MLSPSPASWSHGPRRVWHCTPPPSQAPTEIAYVAELRPELGSAARFTRGGIAGLPPSAAFAGIRGAAPLLPMAPERIRRGVPREPFDAPEQVLRRLVLLQFPADIDAASRRQQLLATGLFNRVDQRPRTPELITFAQADSDPLAMFNSDPHRWQWALPAIEASGETGAWHYTLGRAQVASLDGGIVPTHPDVQAGPLSNFREHQSARARFTGTPGPQPRLLPSELGTTPGNGNYEFLHHGVHVNTLMTAPINGLGIAGVCPQCTLQTFRTDQVLDVLPLTTLLTARFGSTALNHSFERALTGNNEYPFAIAAVIARDVVMVASAGNSADGISSWTSPLGSPHRFDEVLKIGATDPQNHLWSELRILTAIPPAPQHPVRTLANVTCVDPTVTCVPAQILARCSQGGSFSQCGSNFGLSNNIIDLVAPGVQVIAGMVEGAPPTQGIYRPVAPEAVNNPEAVPPSATGLGVDGAGVAVRNPAVVAHGPQTGTSMAAPHVTATAGLMRSINPLLSATSVRQGLRDGANPNVPGYTLARMGAGLLNARNAVERAAGAVRGSVQRNRLVPMFALYAATTTVPEEIGAEEAEVFGSQPLHSWLYTTNPQLASAATAMDIYRSNDAAFSPTMPAAYEHSHLLQPMSRRIGIPIPPTLYTLPSGAGKGFRNPAASFWVFTTPHSPLPGYTLQPLYRLSTHHAPACAAEQRKHLYTTSASEAQRLIGGTPVCGVHPLTMRYRFESVEGYIFDRAGPRPPGALALFRGYNPQFKVAALVVESEELTTAFDGYSVNTLTQTINDDFLGWVYPSFRRPDPDLDPTQPSTLPADRDNDGLIDGLELAFGLNEQSADGDCDGASDAVEYGFANLPDDPMSPTATCTDGRLNAVYNAGQQTVAVTLSNPVGPVALPDGTKVMVYFTAPAQGPIVLMGGGRSQCQSIATIGWDSAFECTLDASLPVGPNSAIVWEWTNVGGPSFQPGQNVAAITVIPGLGDPVSGNDSRVSERVVRALDLASARSHRPPQPCEATRTL